MRKLKLVALFMMVLVLSIPVVIAQELNLNKFAGEAGINGVSRARDSVTIEATAKIPSEEIIDREQLRLYVGDSYSLFDNCTKLANSTAFKCTWRDPQFEAYEPVQFAVKLYNDDGKELLSKTDTIQPDSLAPVFKNFTVDPLVTKGEVNLWYSIEDYGLEFGNIQTCSGIKQVQIMQNGNVLLTDIGKSGTCHKENSVKYTLNESGALCVVASDFAGGESAARCSKIVKVDKLPPQIGELAITDNLGGEIHHVKKGDERLATVTVDITDDSDVDKTSVTADFSKLSASLKDPVPPSSSTGDLYVWKDIPVSAVQTCKVVVKAKDILGGESSKEFTCSITNDDTAPIIKGIISTKSRGNLSLVGRQDILQVDIEDKDDTGGIGSGVASAYLKSSALFGSSALVTSRACLQTESNWRCSWVISPPIGTPEDAYEIEVGASDALGNAAEPVNVNVIYDGTPPSQPVVVKVNVLRGEEGTNYQSSGSSVSVMGNQVLTSPTGSVTAMGAITGSATAGETKNVGVIVGDTIQYTVRSKGFSRDLSKANFSDIGVDDLIGPKFCNSPNASEGETTDCNTEPCDCLFEGTVVVSGPYYADFYFNFKDDAGNTARGNVTQEIYGLDNETKPKYWTPEVSCSPKLIDRSTSSKINAYVSCRVHLKGKQKSVSPLSIKGPESPSDCTGPVDANVNNVYVTNNQEGSTDPYLTLKLEAKDFYVDQLNFTCPLSIVTKRTVTANNKKQTFVTPVAQVVNAKFNVSFYNEPLRDVYSNVDRQIDAAMKDGMANMAWLGTLRQFLHYAELICQIKVTLTSIVTVFFTITAVIGALKDTCVATVGTTCPATISAYGIACGGTEVLQDTIKDVSDVLDVICSFINCAQATPPQAGAAPGMKDNAYGVPWCQSLVELIKLLPAVGSGVEQSGASFNIKDSLIWSSICLCLPGIVENLEKLRQVHCFDAVCLYDKVRSEGYPVSYCKEMGAFLMCQYVVGQIFAAIPFANFFNKLIDLVANVLTDPAAAFTFVIGATCALTCLASETPGLTFMYVICAAIKVIAMAAEAIGSVVRMAKTKGFFSNIPGDQYCKRMDKIKEERKEKKPSSGGGSSGDSAPSGSGGVQVAGGSSGSSEEKPASPKPSSTPRAPAETTRTTTAPPAAETKTTAPAIAPPATTAQPPAAAPSAPAATPKTVDVAIQNIAFATPSLTINAGDTVRWTNKDTVPHTATGDGFDTGTISPGASKTQTFTDPGTFSYACSFHPSMKGTITVK